MQFPYRIKIMYGQTTSKLATIQYVNQFMNQSAVGKYEKWNLTHPYKDKHGNYVPKGGELMGLEIGFADRRDAIHFKLGFNQDGQEITSVNLGDDGEKAQRV